MWAVGRRKSKTNLGRAWSWALIRTLLLFYNFVESRNNHCFRNDCFQTCPKISRHYPLHQGAARIQTVSRLFEWKAAEKYHHGRSWNARQIEMKRQKKKLICSVKIDFPEFWLGHQAGLVICTRSVYIHTMFRPSSKINTYNSAHAACWWMLLGSHRGWLLGEAMRAMWDDGMGWDGCFNCRLW